MTSARIRDISFFAHLVVGLDGPVLQVVVWVSHGFVLDRSPLPGRVVTHPDLPYAPTWVGGPGHR